jgi:hypothetical protein
MDLSFLAQADTVTLKLELAKNSFDAAKASLEAAKEEYDALLAQADTHGIPRAKLKKLTEDRVAALFEAGLLNARVESKPSEPRKKKIKTEEKLEADLAPSMPESEFAGEANA